MTDNLDLNKEGIENNFLDVLKGVIRRLEALENGNASVGSLDELSGDLGIISAGEFRSPSDPENPKEPGSGFDGVRISGTGMRYGAYDYAIAGALADSLRFGFRLLDGAGVFAGGLATISDAGIQLGMLNYAIKQTSNVSGNERVGKLLMKQDTVIGEPGVGLEFSDLPSATILGTNAGFELGDFTQWTKTIESNGTWVIDDLTKVDGDYSVYFDVPGTAQGIGMLNYDRELCTAGSSYAFKGSMKASLMDGAHVITKRINVIWYDHASAGNVLSTDIVAADDGTGDFDWVVYEANFKAPVGALSFVISLSVVGSTNQVCRIHFDSLFAGTLTINQLLLLTDSGLTINGNAIGAAEYPNRFACMGDELKSTASMPATYSTSQTYTVYWVQSAANSNDGDTYTFSCVLDSGAYNITVLGALANTAALIDVYIDDVLVASGWDWYAAATTYNTKKILYDRVIATGGLHTFKFVVNGKNASSTDYVWAVTKIMVSKDSDLTGYGGSRTVTINSNGQNSIGSLNPTNVYSANLYVGEMNNLAANVFRGLVYFADLSNGQGIPAGATITGAKLKLCPKTDYANNAGTIEVYRLLRSGIVVSQATWNIYSKGNSWETAGCAGTTSDREATTIGTLATANNLTIDTYIEITLDPALVQEMILNGDLANYGLHLKTTSESDDGYEYYPYNGTYPAQLQITYSVTEP